jgi:glutaredoxin-related protein
VFGGKKSWYQGDDPDLAEALDKLEKLECEYDFMEKEKSLFEGECAKVKRDLRELEERAKEQNSKVDQLEQ